MDPNEPRVIQRTRARKTNPRLPIPITIQRSRARKTIAGINPPINFDELPDDAIIAMVKQMKVSEAENFCNSSERIRDLCTKRMNEIRIPIARNSTPMELKQIGDIYFKDGIVDMFLYKQQKYIRKLYNFVSEMPYSKRRSMSGVIVWCCIEQFLRENNIHTSINRFFFYNRLRTRNILSNAMFKTIGHIQWIIIHFININFLKALYLLHFHNEATHNEVVYEIVSMSPRRLCYYLDLSIPNQIHYIVQYLNNGEMPTIIQKMMEQFLDILQYGIPENTLKIGFRRNFQYASLIDRDRPADLTEQEIADLAANIENIFAWLDDTDVDSDIESDMSQLNESDSFESWSSDTNTSVTNSDNYPMQPQAQIDDSESELFTSETESAGDSDSTMSFESEIEDYEDPHTESDSENEDNNNESEDEDEQESESEDEDEEEQEIRLEVDTEGVTNTFMNILNRHFMNDNRDQLINQLVDNFTSELKVTTIDL